MEPQSGPPTTTENTFLLERRIVLLVHSAIAGASLAAVLQLASRETQTPLLLVSLACFAIAIPSAIAMVILSQVIFGLGNRSGISGQTWPALSYVLAVADQLACSAGFLALFWNFHWIIGLIFLAAEVLAVLTVWMAELKLRRVGVYLARQPAETGKN